MGKYIENAAFGKYTMEDLCNPHSGVISFFIEMQNELSHPDIFVTIAKSADLGAYGFPYSYYSNGSGAALTATASAYAAIGETMERYCIAVVHPEDLELTTYSELAKRKQKAVGPAEWSLFDDTQEIEPFVRFDENTVIAWKLASSLVHKVNKYVPATLVHLPYYTSFDNQGEKNINVSVSTGAACATTLREAMFKGICELVERDAFMITWKRQISCPKIFIDEKSGIYDVYKRAFERPGLDFSIYYTTLDLGMPSFWGILSGTTGENKWHLVGGAAHPDPEVAVLKTLIELAQGLAWRDYKGEKKFHATDGYKNIEDFENRMELYAYNDMSEAFEFLPKESTLNLSDIKKSHGYDGNNLAAALKNIINDFKAKEYDILAVDMTTPEAYEAGLYVVKILIPALEVMDGNYNYQYLGGKRWKEVPAKMGVKYNQDIIINPFPHPYP